MIWNLDGNVTFNISRFHFQNSLQNGFHSSMEITTKLPFLQEFGKKFREIKNIYKLIWRKFFHGNYEISLSWKKFVKATVLLKKLLRSWFHEIFFVRDNFLNAIQFHEFFWNTLIFWLNICNCSYRFTGLVLFWWAKNVRKLL